MDPRATTVTTTLLRGCSRSICISAPRRLSLEALFLTFSFTLLMQPPYHFGRCTSGAPVDCGVDQLPDDGRFY